MSSSSLLYSQCFGQCILRPSSGVSCQTRELSRNFKPNPLSTGSVESSELALEFDMKHPKKADRCFKRNIVNITIKVNISVQMFL